MIFKILGTLAMLINLMDASQKADYAQEIKGLELNTRHEKNAVAATPFPYLVNEELIRSINKKFENLIHALTKVSAAYKSDTKIQSYFNLDQRVHKLLLESRPADNIFLGRFDFTINDKLTPKIYEFNTAAPAGLVISKEIYNQQVHLNIFKMLFANRSYQLLPFAHLTSDVFFEMAKAKKADMKHIAFINSKFQTMTTELNELKNEFERHGIKASVSHLEDLNINTEELILNGEKVDTVFIKIDINILDNFEAPLTKEKKYQDFLIKCQNQNSLTVLNDFYSYWLIDNKSTLSFLLDEDFHYLFTAEEKALLHEVLPETLKTNTLSHEQLLHVCEKKNQFVLKRSHDTRGRNVFVGLDSSVDEWEKRLKASVKSGDYILQEYISPLQHTHENTTYYTTFANYLMKGQSKGWISRTSPQKITNVGQGGMMQTVLGYR